MLFEYSGDNLRVNMGEETANYMVLRDGRVYVVADSDGSIMVIDASQAWSMFGGMASAATPDMVANKVVSLEATGAKEAHAGVTGEVYKLRYSTEDGSVRETDLVLSDDPRAKAFRDAMHNFAMTMANTVGKDYGDANDDMQKRLDDLDKGVLRYGEDMRVSALSTASVDAARFDLPAEPTDLSSLGAIFGGGAAAGENGEQGSGGPISSFLGKLGRTGESGEEEEAASEEDSAETGSAAEELGKAFGRLFGN